MVEKLNKNDDEATQYSVGNQSKLISEKQSVSSRFTREEQE